MSKKARTDDEDVHHDSSSSAVSRGVLDELLADLKSEISESNKKEVQTATSRMESNVTGSFSSLIRRIDESNQQRFSVIESNIGDLNARAEKFEQDQKHL